MNVGTLYAQLTLATGQFDQGLIGAGNRLRSFGAQVTQTGRDIMVLTAPLAAVGGAAISTGMNFDVAMAKIEGLVGITGRDLEMLRQAAIRLAGETAKSPEELADALYYLTSSGMSAAESIDVLRSSARAASSGLGVTRDVAKAVAFAVNAYRDSGLTAAQATDILTAAVKDGTIEASELAPELGRLLPIAAGLHISYNQVAGTLAVMSRTGLDAAEAATSMSSIFSNLVKPSAAARDVLASVGLSMAELRDVASREPDGLIQVYRLLNSTLNEEQFSTVVPNVRALRGAMNFLTQDAESVDQVMRDVAESTGDSDTAFNVMAQTAQFRLNQTIADAQVALLDLWEVIKEPLISVLKEASKVIKDVADWFKHLDDGTKKMILTVGVLLVSLGPVLIMFGSLIKVAGSLVSGFGSIIGGVGNLLKALPMLISPIGLIVIGIGAFALALLDMATASDRGKQAADDLIHSIAVERGGFQTLAEAQEGAAEAARKLAEKYNNLPLTDVLLDTLPLIGGMRMASRAMEEQAAFAELDAAAQKELADEQARQNVIMAQQQADKASEALMGLHDTMKALGPDFVMTDEYAQVLATRFGVTTQDVIGMTQSIGEEFGNMHDQIVAALSDMDPSMELTEEKAQEMATLLGVSAEQVVAQWQAMQAAAGNFGVDMNAALGSVSEKAEESWQKFNAAARYSMDDVQARIDVLKARLVEMDQVDLASLGPSAQSSWQEARTETESELSQLVAYVDSGGKLIAEDMRTTADEVKASADDMASALSDLAGSADSSWKAFKKALKKDKGDPEDRIKELQDQLTQLNEIDLQKLGPAALAAWLRARTNTESELNQLTSFIENKDDIVENAIPDAIDRSVTASGEQWDDMFDLTDDQVTDIVDTVEGGAEDVGDALPDELAGSQGDLEDGLSDVGSSVDQTYGDASDTATSESESIAGALPSELQGAGRALDTALASVARVVRSVFAAIQAEAGTFGTNIGSAWINGMEQRIRSGRSEIDSAANYATASLQSHSPPHVGPLKEIDTWARNMARTWIVPFQDEIRGSGLLDTLQPTAMLGRVNASTSPDLIPAVQRGYERSGRMGDMSPIVQHIYGYTHDEVERQTRRAIRREADALGWQQ